MKTSILMAAIVAFTMGTGQVFAQDGKEPELTLTPVKGPLYVFKGRGGTVMASVGQDGILLVDANYAETAAAYDEKLVELTGSELTPRFLINTHWHSDHTGGNNYFGERGSVILAHENIRARMSTRQEIKRMNRVVEPSPGPALPVVTYGDSIVLHFNGDDIEVQHYPRGHTDGDSVVYFAAENVVHVGDILFTAQFPFVDVGSGGNVFGLIDNVAAILDRIDDQTVVVAGHGAITDKAGLASYHQMLVATSGQVKASLAKGMTIEEITERGLGDEWDIWGEGWIDEPSWIGFIAESL